MHQVIGVNGVSYNISKSDRVVPNCSPSFYVSTLLIRIITLLRIITQKDYTGQRPATFWRPSGRGYLPYQVEIPSRKFKNVFFRLRPVLSRTCLRSSHERGGSHVLAVASVGPEEGGGVTCIATAGYTYEIDSIRFLFLPDRARRINTYVLLLTVIFAGA